VTQPTQRSHAGVQPLFHAIDRIRKGAEDFQTNLFASREQLEDWSAHELLSWIDRGDCLLIFRTGQELEYVYHAGRNLTAISEALEYFNAKATANLVADLVGIPTKIDPIAGVYEAAGFREHATLQRMVRIASPDAAEFTDHEPPSGVALATAADVSAIGAFFLQLLDRFVDQIPGFEELNDAVERGNILVARCGEAIGGVLFFIRTGLTATLRYWYVSPDLRDQGVGARLMKAFLNICRDARRFVLWVASDNLPSITKYQHYGFQMEQLTDRIMIRRTSECRVQEA